MKSATGKLFQNVAPNRVGRSAFDLSYYKLLTCDLMQLIPICCDEYVPGDFVTYGNEILCRLLPTVAPLMHQIDVCVHYYFVPYRKLWDAETNEITEDTGNWEDFITGGVQGTDASTIPKWDSPTTTLGSLWDYLGFPIGVTPTSRLPIDFPRRAYNYIFNEFYLDAQIVTEKDLQQETILNRAWEKDYFTSCRTDLQLGTPLSLPLTGTTNATWAAAVDLDWPAVNSTAPANMQVNGAQTNPATAGTKALLELGNVNDSDLEANVIDFADAGTFDVSDLRQLMATQHWLELNQRAGGRYCESLRSHFGTSPNDSRLDRPEYLGGSKGNIVVSAVLQTSETDTTPQGEMTGHGIHSARNFCFKYKVEEFGLIMGLMSIMPKPVYEEGIDRQWLHYDNLDFYWPEFANMSEQAVEEVELYASAVGGNNTTVFGYQGRYDEYRVKRNMVCGEMRTGQTYTDWHLSRILGARPTLNEAFLYEDPRKDWLANSDEPACMIQFGNIIKAVRPIPFIANPGIQKL